jgi:hypothetical protein
MKRCLTCVLAVILSGWILSCTTDDVEGEIPPPTGGAELVEIPDPAFGEYMLYNKIPGITSEIENNQVKYFLNPDEVLVVSQLSLSKTSGNVQALVDAGLETAETKITDLTGLEYFVGLQVLNLTSNDVTSIDLTTLSALEDLGLNFNLIGSLDVTQNPDLISLRAAASAQAQDSQKMSGIDLSNNTALRELRLSNHDFVNIDLSNNLQIDVSLRMEGNPGPDGDPETGDIIIPAVIYDQLAPENRLGVISDADVETTVFLSVNPSLISEDEGLSTLTVSLNRSSNVPIEINLEFSGSATLGTDFTASETVTIPAGDIESTIEISAIQDTDIEGNETIVINLGEITNATAGENQEGSITIEDDDFNIPLILNEILYDPPSGSEGDANGDGTRDAQEDEFIELYNDSNSELDVSGFMIFDTEALDTNTPRHVVPDGTIIPPNSALVIFGGGNPTGSFGGSIVQASTTGTMNLNNAGDVLTVQDSNGVTVITFDIEPLSGNPDESYTRSPDITGEFVQHADIVSGVLFSPGTKIDGSSF